MARNSTELRAIFVSVIWSAAKAPQLLTGRLLRCD
jgi:hypothetical protein